MLDVQKIIKQEIQTKFKNIDPTTLNFESSSDDGIYLDLNKGQYLISVGKNVIKDQVYRVLTVIHMDFAEGVKTEDDRPNFDYWEFDPSVSLLKHKNFPPEIVWVQKSDKIVKDKIVERLADQCKLEKNGLVSNKKIYGLKPNEIKFRQKITD